MSYLNMNQNSSYNFRAPNIAADADKKLEVVFPTQEAQAPVVAAGTPVEINRQTTVIDLGELAANTTVNATIGDDVERGAIVMIKAKSDGTARNVTFGDGFTVPAMAGTISKTKVISCMYDGASFLPMGAAIQID